MVVAVDGSPMTLVKTITTAETSIAPPPMLRHLVDKGDWHLGVLPSDWVEPQQRALCGHVWDRLGISPDGPLCDSCADEFIRRHGYPHPLDQRAR